MTRILQVRRGTAAQNNNFTGLAGEITMDTTNKTLRVHDGSTLGGFALAKQVEGGNVDPFDINSVSSDFWTSLFETYQTHDAVTIQSETSGTMPLISTNYFDYEFDYENMPIFAEAFLVCQTPEAGYSINDEVRAFGVGNYGPLINVYLEDNSAHVRLFVANQDFWVCHKTNGTKTTINKTRWVLKMKVYY